LREVSPGVWHSVVDRPPDPTTGRRRQSRKTIRGGRVEAERRHAELLRTADVEKGPGWDPSQFSVCDVVRAFIDDGGADAPWSPSTQREYKRILRVEIEPKWGHTRASDLNAKSVKAWHRDLAAGRRPGSNNGRPLAAKSVVRYHALLAASYVWAATDAEIISSNPVAGIRPKSGGKTEIDAPDALAVHDCLAAAVRYNAEMGTAMRLKAATGVRRSTLCGFRWSDIDWERGDIAALRSVVVGEAGVVVKSGGKNGKRSRKALDPETLEVLKRHHAAMTARCVAVGGLLAPEAYVFSSHPICANPWRPDSVSTAWRRVRKAANHPGLRLHDLRHFHVSDRPVGRRRPSHRGGRTARSRSSVHNRKHVWTCCTGQGSARRRDHRESTRLTPGDATLTATGRRAMGHDQARNLRPGGLCADRYSCRDVYEEGGAARRPQKWGSSGS